MKCSRILTFALVLMSNLSSLNNLLSGNTAWYNFLISAIIVLFPFASSVSYRNEQKEIIDLKMKTELFYIKRATLFLVTSLTVLLVLNLMEVDFFISTQLGLLTYIMGVASLEDEMTHGVDRHTLRLVYGFNHLLTIAYFVVDGNTWYSYLLLTLTFLVFMGMLLFMGNDMLGASDARIFLTLGPLQVLLFGAYMIGAFAFGVLVATIYQKVEQKGNKKLPIPMSTPLYFGSVPVLLVAGILGGL